MPCAFVVFCSCGCIVFHFINRPQFITSYMIDGCLNCVQILAVTAIATMTVFESIRIHYIHLIFLLGICLGGELLDHKFW